MTDTKGQGAPSDAWVDPVAEHWIAELPEAVRRPVLAFADPHPPGARARAVYAATAICETVRAWPAGAPGLDEAIADLVRRLTSVGQGTAHQPGVTNMIAFMLADGIEPTAACADRLSERLEEGTASVARASEAMAGVGADLLQHGDRVLVHDFADRSTQAVITRAGQQGKRLHVIATACRSRRADGLKVAEESVRAGHSTTVVTDAGIGWAMGHQDLAAAFVGADAVMVDGTLLTTPGALTVGMVGQDCGVPVYAVTDLWKILPSLSAQLQEINEAADPDGVPEALDWAERGYRYLNPLVDILPGRFVTSYVTEAGVIKPSDVGDTANRLYGTPLTQVSARQ